MTTKVKRDKSSRRLGSAAFVDLDETLLYSVFADDNDNEGLSTTPPPTDYDIDGIRGHHRPYAHDLLRFLRERFDYLYVFTAGNRAYAASMVKALFEPLPFRPDRVFDRSRCVQESENTAFLEYWRKYTKMLDRLDLPSDVDLDDSILIDDLANNARNNMAQTILVPKYQYSASFEDDDWLLHLRRYLAAKPTEKKWSELDKTAWFLSEASQEASESRWTFR